MNAEFFSTVQLSPTDDSRLDFRDRTIIVCPRSGIEMKVTRANQID